MSNPKLGKAKWMTLREFEPDVFVHWLLAEAKAGRMSEERMNKADWGVSPQFLINASFDSSAADRSRWMQPVIFVTGVSMGMISAAIMSIEEPLSLLLF